jgi:type III secretion protein L
MDETVATVLRAGTELSRTVRPLARIGPLWRARVVEDLRAIDEELFGLERAAREELERARVEAEQIRSRAREEGVELGLKECVTQIARARAEYGRLQARAEEDLVRLAFEVARRLVHHTLETRPEVVVSMVKEAMKSARGRRTLVVSVHPQDLEALQAARQELVESVEGVPVHFEAAPDLERGDCVIETESGRIDARLSTQIAVLREGLWERR